MKQMRRGIGIWLFMAVVLSPLQAQFPSVVLDKVIFQDAALDAALEIIAAKSGYSISFSRESLPPLRISGSYRRQTTEDLLRKILDGTGLTYRVIGKQIVIFKAPPQIEQKFTISGFLYDESSGEPLIGGVIQSAWPRKLAVSNEYGFFSMTLPAGDISVQFSYLGYEQQVHEFSLNQDTALSVELQTALVLTEVVVRASSGNSKGIGAHTSPIDAADAELMPSLGGEADIMRSLHLLPGVQTGTDGIEGILVRGGSQGHNLVLIDGVPVYNYGHAAGIFSVFNTAAVRSIRFLKGGFPARYAGRLASVLDVRTKEGNMRNFSGRADIGVLSSRLTLEGPLVKEKAAFFVSGRTSLINWYLRPLSENFKQGRGETGRTKYGFGDFNAKFHTALSPKDKVYLSLYKGRDQFDNSGFQPRRFSLTDLNTGNLINLRYDRSYRDAFHWGNTIGSLRWNHVFGNKLFLNTTAMYSRLDVQIQYENADSLVLLQPNLLLGRSINVGRYTSGIEERGLRFDANLAASTEHYWRFGLGFAARNFRPGAIVFDERAESTGTNLANTPLRGTEIFAYLEDEFSIGNRISGNAGIHLVSWEVEGRRYSALQPRLMVMWEALPEIRLRLAHSRMSQFLHLLSNSDIGLPTDLWVPSTGNIRPEIALQYETGISISTIPKLQIDFDVYYKDMKHLLAFTEGASTLNDWRQNVTQGEGTAMGAEIMLRYDTEKHTAWLSYGLGHTNRRFDRINLGQTFPFKYDRRHDLKLAGAQKLSPRWTLSANWVFASGFAYSLPLTEFSFQLPGNPDPPIVVGDFQSKNRYRMPWYHRLDVQAQYSVRKEKWSHVLNLGVYNIYNRHNPLYYNVRTQLETVNNQLRETSKFVQVWLLPILPSVSYSISF